MSVGRELSAAAIKRVRRLLQREAITQAALGRRTGTAQATVSDFLNGRQPNWAINTLVRMVTALRHDVGIVFIPIGEPYRWCGEQECAGWHFIGLGEGPLDDEETGRRPVCHGAPVR